MEKLNGIHHHFKDHYQNFTFDKRCEKFIDREEKNIHIELVVDKLSPVGYCISTIIEKMVGEIDSIFIEKKYRNNGFGRQLPEIDGIY